MVRGRQASLQGKHRGYCFTCNNYTPEDETYLKSIECKYLIFGREIAPTTGTPHLQGYIQFQNPRSATAVVSLLRRCHVLIANGSPSSNKIYCSKSGDYHEKGDCPEDAIERSNDQGERERERYQAAWDYAKSGELERIDPDIRIRCYSTLKRIKIDYQKKVEDLPVGTISGLWIYGPTGTGKSHSVAAAYPDAYRKPHSNKWWDGYQGESIVWIDDLDVFDKSLGGLIKIWVDRYAFQAECKGGSTCLIRPLKIIVTSNFTIQEIWGADERFSGPIKRRFKILEKPLRETEIQFNLT